MTESKAIVGKIKFLDEQGNELDSLRTSAQADPLPTDDLVDAWFQGNFHGLPISTDLFNRFQAAKELLKEQLRAQLKKE